MKCKTRKEALLAGEKFYYPDKPCKRNHKKKRLTVSGSCFYCNKITCKANYHKLKAAYDEVRRAKYGVEDDE